MGTPHATDTIVLTCPRCGQLPPGRPTANSCGHARLNPADSNVPEISDELADAHALTDLAHQLLEATVTDIEAITHTPAHLTR